MLILPDLKSGLSSPGLPNLECNNWNSHIESDLNLIGREIVFARTVASRVSKGILTIVDPNLFVSISLTHLRPPGDLFKKIH